jgi:hypothetical protein
MSIQTLHTIPSNTIVTLKLTGVEQWHTGKMISYILSSFGWGQILKIDKILKSVNGVHKYIAYVHYKNWNMEHINVLEHLKQKSENEIQSWYDKDNYWCIKLTYWKSPTTKNKFYKIPHFVPRAVFVDNSNLSQLE